MSNTLLKIYFIPIFHLFSVYGGYIFLVNYYFGTSFSVLAGQEVAILKSVSFRNFEKYFQNLKMMSVSPHHLNSRLLFRIRGEKWSPAHVNFWIGN